MRLLDVTFRDSVNEPDTATPMLRAFEGHTAIATLTLDQGLVTLTGWKGGVRLVPIQNVKFMTPAKPEPKK